MSDNRPDQEARSWEDAEAASSELPAQLRVLQRMVAAAKAQLEELSGPAPDLDADPFADHEHPAAGKDAQ